VTDNAQSIYELSLIEQDPTVVQEIKRDYNVDVNFEHAKDMLEAPTAGVTRSRPQPSLS